MEGNEEVASQYGTVYPDTSTGGSGSWRARLGEGEEAHSMCAEGAGGTVSSLLSQCSCCGQGEGGAGRDTLITKGFPTKSGASL